MTTRDWADERAAELAQELRVSAWGVPVKPIAAALREARQAERDEIAARLREPDEAMAQYIANMVGFGDVQANERMEIARVHGAALADVLFPPSKEGE